MAQNYLFTKPPQENRPCTATDGTFMCMLGILKDQLARLKQLKLHGYSKEPLNEHYQDRFERKM